MLRTVSCLSATTHRSTSKVCPVHRYTLDTEGVLVANEPSTMVWRLCVGLGGGLGGGGTGGGGLGGGSGLGGGGNGGGGPGGELHVPRSVYSSVALHVAPELHSPRSTTFPSAGAWYIRYDGPLIEQPSSSTDKTELFVES